MFRITTAKEFCLNISQEELWNYDPFVVLNLNRKSVSANPFKTSPIIQVLKGNPVFTTGGGETNQEAKGYYSQGRRPEILCSVAFPGINK